VDNTLKVNWIHVKFQYTHSPFVQLNQHIVPNLFMSIDACVSYTMSMYLL